LTSAAIAAEPQRISIADDAASCRDLSRSILEVSIYAVKEAVHGAEVLENAEGFRPHLIIRDLERSKLDGYATAAALRQIPKLRLTPIIPLTTAPSQTAPEKISEGGFSGYLVQPIGRPGCANAWPKLSSPVR
jgi:CheY-like chemotaxis protein